MRDELNRWLDGEISDDEIPPELRADAERVRALLDTPRTVGPAPDWIESRVMHALPERRRGYRRALAWLVRPQPIRVRPASAGALALAALAALLFWPGQPGPAEPGPVTGTAESPAQTAATRTDDGRVYVQFVYVAPEAGAVNVAGDFNEWDETRFELRDADGDGVWTGRMPLSPGLHKYMFVVDGQWVTDPLAERYVDDGFGNRNALISVTQHGSSI